MTEIQDVTQVLEFVKDEFGGFDSFFDHPDVKEAFDDIELQRLTGQGTATVRPRPDVLYGTTQRIETGYGKLYVNINEDADGRPFELFATIGNSGGFTNSFTEALAKCISIALRTDVDPHEIASELQGIRSPRVAWDKGDKVQSIPDAIGRAMQRYLDGELAIEHPQQRTLAETAESSTETDVGGSVEPTEGRDASTEPREASMSQSLIEAGESPECPDCGSMNLHFSEGCKTCRSCGWSEC